MSFDECAKRRSETRKALRIYLLENKEEIPNKHGFVVIKSIKGISKSGFHRWILEISKQIYAQEMKNEQKTELFQLIDDYLTSCRDLEQAKKERNCTILK